MERTISLLVVVLVAGAILYGWLHRHDPWINPEHGLGYALGIVGGSLMLILLAYPVRKRVRPASRAMGSVGFWFRLHMLLGLIGPLAILYHARFSWGALNSAFALGAMIVVSGSGLIGRYFYSRVHRGYSGRKLELRSLREEMDDKLAALAARGVPAEAIMQRLRPFEADAIAAGASFRAGAWAIIGLGFRTRRARAGLRHELGGAERGRIAVRALVDDYFEAVRRAAEFAFYDRLLRLWHLLHLPLFILLVAAAVLHIVAVHMY
ncbi:hypothetical protein ACFOD9_05320 [Novosphingobium bradum]|uniref:Pyridine nucleotide-disulfide oxidoreductase n=1 Tax=Novosphingobium bradum TaxID=1737444 RepID=A0ABV7IQZ1_9SPHN